jgi:ATP-dependent exoDNAse (exonuclease V) beta subunit
MPNRRIYASSLNNVAQCPCFDWKQNDDTTYADRGTSIHEAEETQDHKKLDTFDIIPYEFGLKVLEEKRAEHFEYLNPVERHEEAFRLPGIGRCKIDYNARHGEKVLVIDWKTGVTPHYADSDLQGKAYALAIFQHCPEVDEVVICFADLDT